MKEDLRYSVDYATVAADITEWIQLEKIELLESIVLLGTERILNQYSSVKQCTIE